MRQQESAGVDRCRQEARSCKRKVSSASRTLQRDGMDGLPARPSRHALSHPHGK